jgi:DNA-binding GntR family transcriptional regulator
MTQTTEIMADPRLWVRIAADVRDKLSSGSIAAGDSVSIAQLCEEWGSSRQTAAKALRTLEDDGLIRRYPGVGYYALSPRSMGSES